MTGREDTKSLKRKPTRKQGRKGKIFDTRTHPPPSRSPFRAIISTTLPKLRSPYSPSRSSLPSSFLSFDSLPNEGCFVTVECVSRLSFKHVYLAFFSRVRHTVSSFARPVLPPRFIHTIFDVAVSSYPLARHPSPLLFSLPFPSPPTVPFRFIPLRARPSLSLGARTDARGDVPFYFIRGYEFFHPRRTGVSLAPTAPSSRGESQDGTRGLAFVDEGRDVADGQSIFFFFYFFLPFFENFLFLLVIESIPLECRFSSERGDLSGKVNWYCVKIEERTSSSRSM